LLAVLSDVADAEPGEQVEVAPREELRHDDEVDVLALPSGGPAGGGDPVLHGGEVGGELRATPVVLPDHVLRPTIPAKRPVVPSRRWEYSASSSRAHPATHSRGTSSALSCSTTPAATSMAGVPRQLIAAEDDAAAATSVRSPAGTS